VLKVSRQQVLAYRVSAQGLHREATALGELAALDIGVQHASADGARLAFDARLAATPPVDGVGPGRRLAYVWSFRGAPNVHRRRDLDGLASALWPMSEADAVARLGAASSARKAGIDALDAYAMTVAALRKVVTKATGKGAASAAVTAEVPAALIRHCRVCRARHVFELPFRIGVLPAGLELEPDTAPPVLRPRVKAKPAAGFNAAALHRVVRNYLNLLGPAGPAEVAGYLDARRADVAEHWPEDLTEVSVDGTTAWLPADRVEQLAHSPEPAVVRLLGAFDPWLQARDRKLIVPDSSVHKALWPVLGRPGVLFVDGEVAGTWRPKASGKRLGLTVEPFAGLTKGTWAAVEHEAERVAAVRGYADVNVRRVS
jgi:Winged helix DNA-binding domain